MSLPRVSVCLLVYNHAHVLGAVVDSIRAQTLADFELIISDDCSTDDSWAVIQSYASRDARIKPQRTPRNLGMAGNANFACSAARSGYIALLHHDDLVDPRLLEKWIDVAERHPTTAFVFNDYRSYSDQASHVLEKRGFREVMNGREFLTRYLLSGWGSPVRGTALIRRECLDELGGFDEGFGLLSDIDLWMRFCGRWDVGYVAEPLIHVTHRRPDDYPKDYTAFSWQRMRILFQIHAAQWRKLSPSRTKRALQWLWFRARVSAEVVKWIGYAVARHKREMLRESPLGRTAFEFPIVNLFRSAALRFWGRG